MTLAAELARREPPARTSAGARVVGYASRDNEDEGAAVPPPAPRSNLKSLVLEELGKHRQRTSWQLIEDLGCTQKDLHRVLSVLTVDCKIEGVRGLGYRLTSGAPSASREEDIPQLAVGVDRALAARCLDLIIDNPGAWTTQKLSPHLDKKLFMVQNAVAHLKEEGKVKAVQGGWLLPTKDSKPEPAAQPLAILQDDATVARFGIDDQGHLAVSKGTLALQLDTDEIKRLDAFLRLSRPLWKGEE